MADGDKDRNFLGWADQLGRLNTSTSEPSGPGWQTFKEILDESPYGVTKTRELLRAGLDDGSIEAFDGSRLSVEGTKVRGRWYRPKS